VAEIGKKAWQKFDFSDLFVLDMANNHQGSLEHGLKIIRQLGKVVARHNVRAAIKFQFRQLDTFLHPSARKGSDNKHIPRFISTELKPADYEVMLDEVRSQGMLAACTPFDEESVDLITDMGFDVLKIASCSATDWPLLTKATSANMPIICSTGGVELDAIDELSSFFFHRGADFAFMHCVSIYPTPMEKLNLNQITSMRKRYGCTIGWSTHEEPDNYGAVQIAVAKGAEMFERHVGLETEQVKLNAYSSTPEQVDRWIAASKEAKQMCGDIDRPPPTEDERLSILSLRRGVYVRKPLKSGAKVTRDSIFFAMPCAEGQMASGEWNADMITNKAHKADQALMSADVAPQEVPSDLAVKHSIHKVKALLNEAGMPLNSEFEVEFSHHFGLANFAEVGAVLINCVNRDYCKKIIVQLPHQRHPKHYHKSKEETFQVIYGILQVEIDGHRKTMHPGETCLIQPGVWHEFWTETGCVFEEISTRDTPGDSVYADISITKMKRSERKTVVDHWGRFQLGH
jgi:sialic acid synthase SpsE/mannose-6-phosphate isomerase-like protein (cupin superfamily)